MKHPHVEQANAYVRDVLNKKRPACRWVHYACRRHLADLKRARGAAFPFRFDPALAERACQFAELLPHVKGHWALPQPGTLAAGKIVLEPFQCFERCMLFGWVEKATGLRRFRIAYIERPRKNGKSTDAAITGLHFLALDGEAGAEVYSGATTEKQAWEVFRPARQMAERSPDFLDEFGVEVHAKSLTVLETGSRFEPIIGKPGDGASPSLAITDEYHEHPDSIQFETMITGMGARRQPLALVITTAGDSIEGPCYALHERVQKMLKGTQPDERLFGIIYSIDEQDDWTKPEALQKANPNYGVSVSADYLREQQQAAIRDSRLQNVFKTKHLNIWCTARAAWMNMEWWHRQADAPPIETFVGESCWIAFDLANRIDLAAAPAFVFMRELEGVQHYYGYGRCYVPEAAVNDPSKRHYQGWAHDGNLIATEGNDCDLARIIGDLAEDARRFLIQQAACDPWNSIGLRDGVQSVGVTLVEMPQQVQHFSGPMKALEALVKDGRFHHDGNPCHTWQMGNVTVRPDAKENIFPRKERSENKIDWPVALIMATSLALNANKKSVYETQGLTVL